MKIGRTGTPFGGTQYRIKPILVAAVSENDDDISDLVNYQKISGHLIFDVKIGGNF